MTTILFTRDDLILRPNDPELKYHRRKDDQKLSVHWGQRKLFIGELQFLTLFWNPQEVPSPIVVYAGAAPGIHIPFLSSLFPQMTFHLYDPASFLMDQHNERIHLYNRKFDVSEAKRWAGRKDVFFISDIRTADYKIMSPEQNEAAIIEDMQNQACWYKIIKPVHALLKFRLPYPGLGQPSKFKYLDGYIFKQVWAPQTTTETRLVPFGDNEVEYDILKYESQMFYHNTQIREQTSFLNPITSQAEPIAKPNLLNDFDSCAEAIILLDYLKKMNGFGNTSMISALSNRITQEMNRHKKTDIYTLETLRQNETKSTTKLACQRSSKLDKKNIRKSRDPDDNKSKNTDDNKSKNIDDNKSKNIDDNKSKNTDDNKSKNIDDNKSKNTDDNKSKNIDDNKSKNTDDNKSKNTDDNKSKNTDENLHI